jgi:hypothetical protein
MQLVAATLVPVACSRAASTAEELRALLRAMAAAEDRIEHVHVVEYAGIMWVGAYATLLDPKLAQDSLRRLCGRLRGIDTGWELVEDGDAGPPAAGDWLTP